MLCFGGPNILLSGVHNNTLDINGTLVRIMVHDCKGITPYMAVFSLATLTTKHSIICLYMVSYYDERRTTKRHT